MLSKEEITQFVRDGFIGKRQVLSAGECDRCLRIGWTELEKMSIKNDPSTWKTHPRLRKIRGVVKLRKEIFDYEELRELTTKNKITLQVIEALMGKAFHTPGVRGVYPTFPIQRSISRPYEPHIEMHPLQVFVMYYLDDVDSQNGALTVWPGSHRALYPHFTSKFDYAPKPEFHRVFDQYNPARPFELTGKKGDVYFLHHRILHAGSNNFKDKIRWGVLVDFLPNNFETLRAQAPDAANVWEDWGEQVQQVARECGAHPLAPRAALSRALRLKMLHASRVMKGKPRHDYTSSNVSALQSKSYGA